MRPLLILVCICFPFTARAVCPELDAFYADEQTDWPILTIQLSRLMPQCLDSAEFFALFGAAQLNSNQLAEAQESLERALLIDPDNGAAQIDYAEALFQQGQIFTALELNGQLLQREDLPEEIEPILQERQLRWRSLTSEISFQAEVLAGYDNNLNGAPDANQITLTLSGEPVLLTLNPEFQAVSGPYLNFRLGGRYRQLSPLHQSNWVTEVRGRFSEDTDSDLLQIDSRYSFIRPGRQRSWQLDAGISNLFFGGEALYTATEGRARYQPASRKLCRPYYGLAAQHQLFHDESHLNAVESKATVGVNCPLGESTQTQQISAEISLLSNLAIKNGRPGGDRNGWQLSADWQYLLDSAVLRAQVNHTQLDDKKGYSPLLAGGAERWLNRSYVLLQYRRPLQIAGTDAAFLVNFYHQRQQSNIELFRTEDSTFEMGISLSF